MADEIDVASEAQERILESNRAYRKPVPGIAPRGYCYNPRCQSDEDFEEGSLKLFCDKTCAAEYEKYN